MMLRFCTALGLLTLLLLPSRADAQPCVDGFAGAYPCHDVDLVAQFPEGNATDIWGWTDPETGVEYAIIFLDGRATFVNLSDPSDPVVVGYVSSLAGKDGRTYGNHLFFVDDGSPNIPGIAVFDLEKLRSAESPPVSFSHDMLYSGLSSIHNIDLNTDSGYAYPVSGGGGAGQQCFGALHIVDVRDPMAPTFAGCFDPDYRFHDTYCVIYDGPDAGYTGHEICFGSAGSRGFVSIVDVTDKSAPSLIAEVPYPNPSYTHQGWLTEDKRYFLLNDELDEGAFGINTRTLVFDVSDLDEAAFAFEHFAATTATDHNLFVKGDFVYQANYSAGFRVLDLSGIENEVLTEVAYFDTYPANDDSGFRNGAWGVYPYFESGIVIVSDRNRGLFVLRPTFDGFLDAESAPGGPDGLTLAAYPNPFRGTATVELRPGTAQHVSVAVFDVLGRRVATLFEGAAAGDDVYHFDLNARDLPAGTYVVRVTSESGVVTRLVTRAN